MIFQKRRGTMGIVMTGLIILTMGLLISCGYLQDEEENRNRDQIEADESSVPTGEQQNLAEGEDFQQADAGSEEAQNVPFFETKLTVVTSIPSGFNMR